MTFTHGPDTFLIHRGLPRRSSLSLSLINVKMIATLSGFRRFEINREIAESAKGPGGLLQLIADEEAKEKQPAAKTVRPQPIPGKKPAGTGRKR